MTVKEMRIQIGLGTLHSEMDKVSEMARDSETDPDVLRFISDCEHIPRPVQCLASFTQARHHRYHRNKI